MVCGEGNKKSMIRVVVAKNEKEGIWSNEYGQQSQEVSGKGSKDME